MALPVVFTIMSDNGSYVRFHRSWFSQGLDRAGNRACAWNYSQNAPAAVEASATAERLAAWESGSVAAGIGGRKQTPRRRDPPIAEASGKFWLTGGQST